MQLLTWPSALTLPVMEIQSLTSSPPCPKVLCICSESSDAEQRLLGLWREYKHATQIDARVSHSPSSVYCYAAHGASLP